MLIKPKKRMIVIIIALIIFAIAITLLVLNLNNKSMTYEEKVAAFELENPTLKKGQIVFLGDSITARYKLGHSYSDLSLEVYNRGISGDTADWIIARMKVSVLDIEPSKVVLMIGTNDINGTKGADEIAQDYDNILGLLASNLPDTEVICVSIIPQNTKFSQNAAQNNLRIKQTNEKIRELAREYGYEYVNLYDELTDTDGLLRRSYSADGLHLGRKGYEVWTRVMKPFLE